MTSEPHDGQDPVEHLVDLVTAHGLVEADRPTVARIRDWLRQVLPASDIGRLDAATRDPGAGPVRDALAQAIFAMLGDNPALLNEMHALSARVAAPRAAADSDPAEA